MHESTFPIWAIILIEICCTFLAGLLSFRVLKTQNGKPITKTDNQGHIVIKTKKLLDPLIAIIGLIIFNLGVTVFYTWQVLSAANSNYNIGETLVICYSALILAAIATFMLSVFYVSVVFSKERLLKKHYAPLYNKKPVDILIVEE